MRPFIGIASEFWDGATGLGLAEGFRHAGFDVATFDARYYGITADGDLPLRVASRLIDGRAMAAYRRHILSQCAAGRPDVFLSIKGSHIDRTVLTTLKAQGAILAMFYPDVNFFHKNVDATLFDLYDFIFTTKRFHLPWMAQNVRGPQVHHIDHGYSTGPHLSLPGEILPDDFRSDVCYVGNYSPYKHDWLARFHKLRPTLSLTVVGPNWEQPTRGTPLQSRLVGPLTSAFYKRVIARSRINIAVHHGPTQNGWADSISTRTFQIPAARGFMLHIDNEEVRRIFAVGTEIDVFSTPEELAERVDFYLAHPERRAAMIDAAYARAVPAYSYDHRAVQMATLMGFAGLHKS